MPAVGLLAGIETLGAGSNIIGKVTTDQTTHGTTDLVAADLTKVGGSSVATGTGAGGSGIPRVTVSNDSAVKLWDGSNTAAVKAASTAAAATDPAAVVAVSPNGGNPCLNPSSTLVAVSGVTSGTSGVQIVAASGSTKIYICSLTVVGVSGTTPKFSLEYGTGSNCVVVPVPFLGLFTTTAGVAYAFANPVYITPASQEVCYIDTGTTPVQDYMMTYVQQ